MSRGQRFTFLAIAVVIAIVAVVVLADSSEDDTSTESSATTTPTATATASPTEAEPGEETPTATPTPTPTPPPPPLLTAGRVRELEFTEGERIRFRVRSDVPEEIHVHCYDITREVPAGDTITVSFEASITGTCEVEFHNSGEQIASLTVQSD
jgi:hypothetical protein